MERRQSKLKNDKAGSLGRLTNLVRNLQQEPQNFKAYDDIIKAQIENTIVERAPVASDANKEFYLPHKPVFREGAETTKLRVVYDASAKSSRESPSLNECLEKRLPLQNLLWNILIRNRFKPYPITADIQKAFLQIRIRDSDRDALRFHWIKNQDINQIDILRFPRLAFGLTQSPFILEETLGKHTSKYREVHKKIVEEIAANMYAGDLISGGYKKEEVIELKEIATKKFREGWFTLHKWHTNCNIKSHENHHETIEHKFTNQITKKSQGSQAQTLGDVLATSGNIIPNVNREISYQEILHLQSSNWVENQQTPKF